MRFSKKLVSTSFYGVVLPLVLLGAGAGIFFALGRSQPKEIVSGNGSLAATLNLIRVAETKIVREFTDDLTLDIDSTGLVVPYREIDVANEVAGRIIFKSEDCDAGRFVSQGTVLFRIDQQNYELEFERLSKEKDQAYAQIKELEQEILNQKRLVEIAEENTELQSKEVERLESLPENFASATDLDAAKQRLLTSRNQEVTISNQLNLLQARRGRLDLAQQLAEARLKQARLNLDRCEIVAPISGVIVSEMAESDSYQQIGTTLCRIEDTSRVEVVTQIRADQLMQILAQNKGEDLDPEDELQKRFTLPKSPAQIRYRVAGIEQSEYTWMGNLSRYDGLGLDPESRTVPCRISVENPGQYLLNGEIPKNRRQGPPALVRGMFVDVAIETQPAQQLILVPKLALRPGNKVWKFIADSSVIETVRKRNQPKKPDDAESDDAPAESEPTDPATENNPENDADRDDEEQKSIEKLPNPDEWVAGRIEVIRNVRGIKIIDLPSPDGEGTEAFWVVVPPPNLSMQDRLVVSPLANLLEDGSDIIRVRINARDTIQLTSAKNNGSK